MIRRQEILKKTDEEFEENFARGIIFLAKEFGWTIEYVLEMDIKRFIVLSEIINEYYEEQKRKSPSGSLSSEFGGLNG